MASIVLQIVVVFVNRKLSEGQLTGHMSVGVTIKIASNGGFNNPLSLSQLIF